MIAGIKNPNLENPKCASTTSCLPKDIRISIKAKNNAAIDNKMILKKVNVFLKIISPVDFSSFFIDLFWYPPFILIDTSFSLRPDSIFSIERSIFILSLSFFIVTPYKALNIYIIPNNSCVLKHKC